MKKLPSTMTPEEKRLRWAEMEKARLAKLVEVYRELDRDRPVAARSPITQLRMAPLA